MITDILIEPVGQQFDTAAVAAYLEKQPHTARDKVRADIFVLADNDEALAEARARDPKRFPTTVIPSFPQSPPHAWSAAAQGSVHLVGTDEDAVLHR